MNQDEYLTAATSIIPKIFRPTDQSGGMVAAIFAVELNHELKTDFRDAGFAKFKDLLHALESRFVIKTGLNSKGALAIWLSVRIPSSSEVRSPDSRRKSYVRSLKKSVWRAFTAPAHFRNRYFNRQTGEVRVFPEDAVTVEEYWTQIEPISADDQKQLARNFVKEHEITSPQILASIESDCWYAAFPQSLKLTSQELLQDWNRSRSLSIINLVRQWCLRYGIDESLVFDSHNQSLAAIQPVVPMPSFPNRETVIDPLKDQLLSVIERLTVDELLRLPLPVHHVVAVLRPDLLK